MNFTTDRLNIAEITVGDVAAIHRLNSYEQVAAFNTIGIPKSLAETEKLVHPVIMDQIHERRKLLGWVIRSRKSAEFIGQLGMHLAAPRFRMAEIHYAVVPEHWGQGYATESVRAMIKFGFDTLGLHRIEAGVATGNERSIRVLEKCGMTREGRKRKVLPIRGEWYDNYHYAILDEDLQKKAAIRL